MFNILKHQHINQKMAYHACIQQLGVTNIVKREKYIYVIYRPRGPDREILARGHENGHLPIRTEHIEQGR